MCTLQCTCNLLSGWAQCYLLKRCIASQGGSGTSPAMLQSSTKQQTPLVWLPRLLHSSFCSTECITTDRNPLDTIHSPAFRCFTAILATRVVVCTELSRYLQCLRRLQYERTARPGALAAGKDALRLQSRVQLLDTHYEGQYMIGAHLGLPAGPKYALHARSVLPTQ